MEYYHHLQYGATAFGAGELILHDKKLTKLKDTDKDLYETLIDAKEKNKQILEMSNKVESESLKKNIKEITESANKIIAAVEKNPNKQKKTSNFFEYYLPVTLNILKNYDEIENQNLASEEGKKFMIQTEDMIEKINSAFKTQLSNLYQSDIIDTDAEMKVFETMLKADGYDTSSDFKKEIKKEENKEG